MFAGIILIMQYDGKVDMTRGHQHSGQKVARLSSSSSQALGCLAYYSLIFPPSSSLGYKN